jgi:hypothetical protein
MTRLSRQDDALVRLEPETCFFNAGRHVGDKASKEIEKTWLRMNRQG